MKITLVCDEYPPRPHGGIGSFVHTLAHALAGAGHEAQVVGFGDRYEVVADGPVRVISLVASRTRGLAWWSNCRRLRSWLKREHAAGGIDVVEAPEYQGWLPFAVPGCPLAVRLHLSATEIAADVGTAAPLTVRWRERRMLTVHRRWIGVSRSIIDRTIARFGIRPSAEAVIYNPVGGVADVDPPPDLPDRFILFAGKVGERKGAFVLAQATRPLLSERPDLHLVFAGPLDAAAHPSADEQIAAALGPVLAHRARFLGRLPRAQVHACMRRAAAVAMPSRLEAFSLVPIEAMACGAAVVYSSEGSGPETIADGITGLLADPRDPEAVGRQLRRLLDDPDLARSLGMRARAAASERFSLDRCVRDTLAFYEDCIATMRADASHAR
jgi:glycosyltransferase involved in cell wall biosynthesis